MKKIFFDEKKYKKLIVIFSVIVLIISMHTFTFDAYTEEGNLCDIYGCANTVDTSDLIDINLYDYGDNINDEYNNNHKYPGFSQSFGVNTNDLDEIFAFHLGDAITEDLEAGTAKGWENTVNTDVSHVPVIGGMHTTLIGGFPALKDTTSLDYLFSSSKYATKKNSNNLSYLFQYNEEKKEYFYNSYNNHAELVKENGIDRFRVYNSRITSNHYIFPFGNFLPLNSISTQTTKTTEMGTNKFNSISQNVAGWESLPDSVIKTQQQKLHAGLENLKNHAYVADIKSGIEHALRIHPLLDMSDDSIAKLVDDANLKNLYTIDYDKPTNFFFGFEMKFNFIQPKNGKIGNENMVFRFDGDDDVWVYIDGVLFLDLTGAHSQLGGEIDFKEGKVTYYNFDKTTYDVSETEARTVYFSELLGEDKLSNGTFKDYTAHTLNFYYMERGAGAGVMHTRFNMPLIEDKAITINKEIVSEDENALGIKDKKYYFQIAKLNNTSSIIDDELFIETPFSYDLYDNEGKKIKTEFSDENGIITLYANQTAVVSGISENAGEYYVRELLDMEYDSVKVNGKDKLTSSSPSITIGGKNYILVASDEKDISDDDNVFTFINDLKVGKLEIEKKLGSNTSSTLEDELFKAYVEINGQALKVGTSYKVDSLNKTVEEAGIIELKPNQVAIIENIVLGSGFEVYEILGSKSGLIDSYMINGTDTGEKKATGTINGSVQVKITNTEKPGTYIEIPIHKTTTNPDGIKYTYNFKLYDVDSKETKSISIKVNERGIGEGKFRIDYSQIDNKDEENEYNYQIYEEKVDSDKTTIYDKSIYDVKVIVKNDSDGFIASYTVSKNNKKVENDNIVFNNIKTFELPKTGSSGMLVITFAGIIFISISFISLFQKKKIGVN